MTDIDMPTEPMVYICMQHKWFGRLPILRNRRRFHVDLEKPLRLFNFGDLVVIEHGSEEAEEAPQEPARSTPSDWRRCVGEQPRLYTWEGKDPIQGLRALVEYLESAPEYQRGSMWGIPFLTITTEFHGDDDDYPVHMKAHIH